MKKTLLLFAMLLGVVGAWAQEDNFVTPETGKFYKLKGDNLAGKPWLTNQLTSNSIVVSANSAEAAIFLKTENGLQDVATGKYLGMNGKIVSLVTNETTITIGDHNDNNATGNGVKYSVKVGDNYMYNNNTDGKTHESSEWKDNIERFWGFVEVNSCLKELTLDNFNADRTTWTLYNGNAHNSGWGYKVVTNTTPAITLHREGNTNDLGWSTKSGIRYPYLVRNKTYLIEVPEDVKIIEYCIQTASEKNYVGEVSYELSNNQIKITLENGTGDAGDAGVTIRKIVLRYVERQSCDITLSDNVGNQHQGTVEAFPGIDTPPTFTGVEYTLTNNAWDGNQFTADIEFKNLPFPVSSEAVANPTFISTYNYSIQAADQFKWYASDDKIKVKEGEEIFSSSIASHLWLIYPKFNNGAFTFQIKNVATDSYINSSFDGNGHDDESTVILSNEATDFTVGKRGNEGAEFINSFDKRLSVNTSAPDPADKIQTVGTYGTHYGTALTFPVPGFNVTIGATGYATLYSPITVLPEAGNQTLEIYQIDSDPENNSVALSPMHYVYKNQGVILKGDSETKYWFALTDWNSFTEEDWKKNKLKGSYVDTYVADPAYVLAKPTIDGIVQEVGLYKAELNMNEAGEKVGKETGTHFLNNAGKAYLPVSALPAEAAEARFFVFDFGGEETAIENVEAENAEQNAVVYDLAGRRVQGAQKGIFIVNGKKVVR